MDKWTYRQIYRCAVGGNARARAHWKTAGVDPHEKIESKYSSMLAHQYKTALEKDVADACRQGLAALQLKGSSGSGAVGSGSTPATSFPSDPFADYINAIAPKPTRSQSGGPAAPSPAPPHLAKSLTAGSATPAPPAAPSAPAAALSL